MANWRALSGVAAVAAVVALGVGISDAQTPGTGLTTVGEVSHPLIGTDRAVAGRIAQARPPVAGTAVPATGEVSAVQTVQLSVTGGELSLASDHATVALERVSGSERDWIGTLPPVQVVDARGTLEGWDLRWTLTSVALGGTTSRRPATVRLEPGVPVVVDGVPDGLAAGTAGPAVRQGRTLLSAAPGNGGGTYAGGGTVMVRLPGSVDADSVVVVLGFALT